MDWAGAAFFNRERLLIDGRPVPPAPHCAGVFAVIDTAVKTGTENDGTAVVYFAYDPVAPIPTIILDWDVVQVEGALLEHWLPNMYLRLEELSRLCRARISLGAFIEDKSSGSVLLQQALRRGMPAQPIKSKLTSLGKDERAISISGYVHQGKIKYSAHAWEKTIVYKGSARNHLVEQIERFRIGDKETKRDDDLLDCFCYGVAIALGNQDGF